ncbi:MAG: MFS transporter [Chloroflexota bacterium]
MLSRLFGHSTLPKQYQSNFLHLYMDIAWFGVLSGSALNFVNIYATRLGASGLQIGLIGAMSAVVNLFLAIPAGRWIEKRNTGQAVFWSSVLFRLGYVLWIPLPWLFDEQGQILALIVLTFLMAVPLTPLGVGFNALFAEAVPSEHRAQVASIRNITVAIAYMGSSLISGYILDNMPFPAGYQIIFLIGAVAAAMSSFHIFFIRPLKSEAASPPSAPQPDLVPHAKSSRGIVSALRLDIWSTPFRNVLIALLALHLTHALTTPIYPLFNVRVLHLSDDNIGTGTALFYLTMLLGSFRLGRLAHSFGNKRVTGIGMVGMAIYPLLLAFAKTVGHYYVISLLGGFTWAFVNGAFANYMLEHIPVTDRPSHLAWYNIILNVALLSSSLLAPLIADQIGLAPALILFGILRILAGLGILRWG